MVSHIYIYKSKFPLKIIKMDHNIQPIGSNITLCVKNPLTKNLKAWKYMQINSEHENHRNRK